MEISLGQEGTPGRLVDGTVIKNEPLKPLLRYKTGPGITLDENSTQLTYKATAAGQPLLEGDTLSLFPPVAGG